jgi:pimeloyl-ACP methyl ester carboxylesterase
MVRPALLIALAFGILGKGTSANTQAVLSQQVQANAVAAPLLFDYEVSPRDNFTKAAFRFWSPRYDRPIRGIVVLVPGFNTDGREMVNDIGWQSFARRYRLALVACFMLGHGYYDAYYDATNGTGDALLQSLKIFPQASSHSEVSAAPLLLYGESAGGQFNYNFAIWKPARVMAFIVNKGGYYDDRKPDPQVYSAPGLFFLGQDDQKYRIKAITSIWAKGSKKGALWVLAPQPNSGHEFSKTAEAARKFFDAVLQNRLPDDIAVSGEIPQIKPMSTSQGWTGNLTTHEIHAGFLDQQTSRDTTWLPDEAFAVVWKAFVSGS